MENKAVEPRVGQMDDLIGLLDKVNERRACLIKTLGERVNRLIVIQEPPVEAETKLVPPYTGILYDLSQKINQAEYDNEKLGLIVDYLNKVV